MARYRRNGVDDLQFSVGSNVAEAFRLAKDPSTQADVLYELMRRLDTPLPSFTVAYDGSYADFVIDLSGQLFLNPSWPADRPLTWHRSAKMIENWASHSSVFLYSNPGCLFWCAMVQLPHQTLVDMLWYGIRARLMESSPRMDRFVGDDIGDGMKIAGVRFISTKATHLLPPGPVCPEPFGQMIEDRLVFQAKKAGSFSRTLEYVDRNLETMSEILERSRR